MLIVLGALTASLLILAYITLVMPNASYVEIYLNDVMGLTDAAYRTFRGQIPSIDFKSLYGAAVYYPAALGFYLDFNAGAVLGFGHFVTAVPLLIMAALASRFVVLPGATNPAPQRSGSRFHRPFSTAPVSLLHQDHVRGRGFGLCGRQQYNVQIQVAPLHYFTIDFCFCYRCNTDIYRL
jgi:hypothetical protein